MAVPNRLAHEGEELVTHRFPTGSLGMASPADVGAATAPAVCAICLPPGALLAIRGIPARLPQQWGVCEREEAVFTQISAAVNTYRDAIRFSGGREVRLQEFRAGIGVRVVDLTGAEQLELESLRALIAPWRGLRKWGRRAPPAPPPGSSNRMNSLRVEAN